MLERGLRPKRRQRGIVPCGKGLTGESSSSAATGYGMASPSFAADVPGSGGPLDEGCLHVIVIRAVVRVRGTSRRHRGGGGSVDRLDERHVTSIDGRARSNSAVADGLKRAEATAAGARRGSLASPQRTLERDGPFR